MEGEYQLPKLWGNLAQDLTQQMNFLCAAPGKTIPVTVKGTSIFTVHALRFYVVHRSYYSTYEKIFVVPVKLYKHVFVMCETVLKSKQS